MLLLKHLTLKVQQISKLKESLNGIKSMKLTPRQRWKQIEMQDQPYYLTPLPSLRRTLHLNTEEKKQRKIERMSHNSNACISKATVQQYFPFS